MRSATRRQRARRTILAALGGLLLLQIGFTFFLPWWHPDTEYRVHQERLEARNAEQPEQPVFAMVGSSRVLFAFDPERMEPLTDADGRPVLSFNFGHFNAGPTANLLTVERMLRSRIKPRWLLVEINPALCSREWSGFAQMASWRDVPTLSKYYDPGRFVGALLRNHLLLPWFRHREELQERYLAESHGDRADLAISSFGWYTRVGESVPTETRRVHTEQQRIAFAGDLGDNFRVPPTVDKAMRDLIEQCRGRGVAVGFVLMPEGETYRSWYSPRAEDRLRDFLTGLKRDYQVPVFDTRRWFDDTYFSDSHHVLLPGTREFTRRFRTEVLDPFFSGTLSVDKTMASHRNP